MNEFFKVFERPEHGTVLMMLKTDDENTPELCFYMKPKGFGVCHIAIGFDEWYKADEAFENMSDAVVDELASIVEAGSSNHE